MTEDKVIEKNLQNLEQEIGIVLNVANQISQSVTTASVVAARKEWGGLVTKAITEN